MASGTAERLRSCSRARARTFSRSIGMGKPPKRTVAMIAEHDGAAAAALEADVATDEGCAAMVGAALERWGRVDVLDNNVGIGSRGSVVEETQERWDRVMHTNVTTMFLASKHAVPAMISSGDGGAIVNVSSISALRPRGLTAYSASKGAVIALTRAMAVDHAPDGIRVNCVAPWSRLHAHGHGRRYERGGAGASAHGVAARCRGDGLGHRNAVCFLASARARYITGQVLVVDGGVTVAAPARGT